MPKRHDDCEAEPRCSTRAARFRCDSCKRKHRDYMREYYRRNRDSINAWRKRTGQWIKGKYGLTLSERDRLFESSDGLCAICYEQPATDIDHDHETGEVRGALCADCNKGLGFIEKKPALLEVREFYFNTKWSAA